MTTENTIQFLSPDYLAGLEQLGQAGQSVIPHVNLSLQFRVTDVPGGAADYYMLIEKGVFTRACRGRLPAADLEIQTALRPLASFQAGELHAATAFVTGTFAVAGDKAKLLELMVAIQAGNYHTFIADLWDRTHVGSSKETNGRATSERFL